MVRFLFEARNFVFYSLKGIWSHKQIASKSCPYFGVGVGALGVWADCGDGPVWTALPCRGHCNGWYSERALGTETMRRKD